MSENPSILSWTIKAPYASWRSNCCSTEFRNVPRTYSSCDTTELVAIVEVFKAAATPGTQHAHHTRSETTDACARR